MGGWWRMFDMTRLFLVAVTLLALLPNRVLAAPLRCTWIQKHQCEPNKPCKVIPAKTFAKIDLQNKQYSRCDRLGCDDYDANISSGDGMFTNIDVTGRGMIVKIAPDQSSTEVVTLGNVVLISQGKCR